MESATMSPANAQKTTTPANASSRDVRAMFIEFPLSVLTSSCQTAVTQRKIDYGNEHQRDDGLNRRRSMQYAFMKRLSIRITLVIILFAGAAAVVISDLAHHAAGRKLRETILAELQPVALKNCTLKRFGSANDGGYLMCENLIEPLDAGYSYGVGGNDDWGCEVSRRYHVTVHQYDCFDPARPTCDGGTFVFHNECVGDRTGYRGPRFFDTLENQIRKNGDIGRRLIIKMEIEGAEWDSLLAAPDELLASIPQIAMHLHGYADPTIVQVIRKLKRNFYLVNLHFNNWSCTPKAVPLPAWAYQVHWVNRRIGVLDTAMPVPAPMSPLNAPDSPTWPDCQLRAPSSRP